MRKYALLILAAGGLLLAAGMAVLGDQESEVASSKIALPEIPFKSFVAGEGIVEANTGNIAIGTPTSGIVTSIYVKWGDYVSADAPLFTIDDRDVRGRLLVAEAQMKEAEADLAKAQNFLGVAQGLKVGRSITNLDKDNRLFNVKIKQAALATATARVQQIKIELELHTIRAPVTGRILQINVRLGEFAQTGALSRSLMVLGDDRPLYLRVSVDENDAWRVRSNAQAEAFERGNPDLKTPLKFVRFEPYIIPKTSLTGASTERTDVRVLQVIYSFDRSALPVYVGQLVDVFISTPPISDASKREPISSVKPKNAP